MVMTMYPRQYRCQVLRLLQPFFVRKEKEEQVENTFCAHADPKGPRRLCTSPVFHIREESKSDTRSRALTNPIGGEYLCILY